MIIVGASGEMLVLSADATYLWHRKDALEIVLTSKPSSRLRASCQSKSLMTAQNATEY